MAILSNKKTWIALAALFVAAVLAATDQLIKNLIVANFSTFELRPFIGEIVQLTYVLNDSAAFSIGFGMTGLFTIISSVASLALIWFIAYRSETLGWSIMAAVLLGGVMGNLVDRFVRNPGGGMGKVVDYIQIPFNFPVFNLADICIVSMAMLAALRIMLGHSIGKAAQAANDR
jgi:signal peptidase II